MREIKHIIIHCADTPARMDIGVDQIRKWHTLPKPAGNGWADIGYHYVIRRSGLTETGRDLDGDGDIEEEVGAHAYGFNRHSLGLCLVGGQGPRGEPESNFTAEQWTALRVLVRDLKARYPGAQVIGHRDVSDKACPSFDVKAWWSNHA